MTVERRGEKFLARVQVDHQRKSKLFETEREARKWIRRTKKRGKERNARPVPNDFWLYRCFDSDKRLLYIGITAEGAKRFRRRTPSS